MSNKACHIDLIPLHVPWPPLIHQPGQQLGQQQRRQLAALKRQVLSLPLSSIVQATSRSTRSTSASSSIPIPVPHLNWEVKLPPNLQKCPLPSRKTTGSGQLLPSCRDADEMRGEQSGREVVAKDLRNFCYECGRHANVHLAPCSACGVVHYCGKKCQKRSWNKGHCRECHYLRQSQRTASKTSERCMTRVPHHTLCVCVSVLLSHCML